jgi:hypothetical protein
MHQRTHDSILLSAMAVAIIAGKIISGALAQPEANIDIIIARTGTADADAGAESSGGTVADGVDVTSTDRAAVSSIQSAPSPCDAAAAKPASTPSAPPPSAQ